MPKTREQKRKIVEELREKIKKWKTLIFVDFGKVKSKELFDLRGKIKKLGKEFKIVKKVLTQIAFDKEKIDFNVKELPGQLALAFGEEEDVDLIKIIFEFSKENENFKILGGVMNSKIFDAEKIIEIGKLPSKKELQTFLLQAISSPLYNFSGVLNSLLRNFVFVLDQIKGQKER
jgi:large subunit ribosomal protein L10